MSDHISQAMRDRFRLPPRKNNAQGGYSEPFKELIYEAVDEGSMNYRDICMKYGLSRPELTEIIRRRYA